MKPVTGFTRGAKGLKQGPKLPLPDQCRPNFSRGGKENREHEIRLILALSGGLAGTKGLGWARLISLRGRFRGVHPAQTRRFSLHTKIKLISLSLSLHRLVSFTENCDEGKKGCHNIVTS